MIAGGLSAVLAAGMIISGAGIASAECVSSQNAQSTNSNVQWIYKKIIVGPSGIIIQKPQSGSNNDTESGSNNNTESDSNNNSESGSNNNTESDSNNNSQSGSNNNNSTGSSESTGSTTEEDSSSVVSAYAKEVVSLVNQERAKVGLDPLVIHTNLTKMAVAKAQDMSDNNYFSHTSPTYGSPFDMMKTFGITYKYAGENIAKGQKTPEEVVNAWMNSPGHKANILNENFTLIGVGYVNGYWAQAFVGK